MGSNQKLREFISRAISGEQPSLGNVEGQERGARDVTLAYLQLDEIELARRWADVGSRGYLDYARFEAEQKLDPQNPAEQLEAVPWKDILYAIELATFAGNEERRTNAAEAVVEWASRPFLEDIRGRDVHFVLDTVVGIGAFVLDQSYESSFETLRTNLAAKESLTLYDQRYRSLANAVEGVDSGEVDQVAVACESLDDVHGSLDTYDSVASKVGNIHSTFCVVLAREYGLNVEYTSDYVPKSARTAYPLD